jgi:hypothetical protein
VLPCAPSNNNAAAAVDSAGLPDPAPSSQGTTSLFPDPAPSSQGTTSLFPDSAPSSRGITAAFPDAAPSSQGTSTPFPDPAPSSQVLSSVALGEAAVAVTRRRRRRSHDERAIPDAALSGGVEDLAPPGHEGLSPHTSGAASTVATKEDSNKKARTN